jgi:hypothetical protein
MLINLHKYARQISLILAIAYVLTGSGLNTLFLQGASHIYASVVFPCKGKNCACDVAGYELKGCQCVHDEKGLEVSCCSAKKTPATESPETPQNIVLENRSCGGQSDDYDHNLAKHVKFEIDQPAAFYFWYINSYSVSSVCLEGLSNPPPGKVPIVS